MTGAPLSSWLRGSYRLLTGAAAVSMALLVSQEALASTVSVVPPNQTVAQTPVTQFKIGVPAVLPATGGHPAVGTVFAIQSYSSSQNTPTSPAPGPSVCVSNGSCPQLDGCVNNPTWPTIAQSISWWQAQNQSLKGSYAYTVGSTYSHQDAEGWIDHCSYTPQPFCPSTAGWTGSYYWVYPNWVSGCNYQPPPSCPQSAGWTGSYTWNGSFWVDHCIYTTQPPCPTGAGWTGSYYWTGSSWADGCSYQQQPQCPANYSGSYSWTGSSWVSHCSANRCPTGAGWTGSVYPNCYYQPQPSCPGGYGGSYSWNGSGWADHCTPPAPPPPKGITYNEYVCLGVTPYGGGCGTNSVGTYTSVTPYCHPYQGEPTSGAYFPTWTYGYPPGVYCFVQ